MVDSASESSEKREGGVRPGHNVLLVRHRGSFILDRYILRSPLKFDGGRLFLDCDGLPYTIPTAGKVEISAE